MSHVVVEHVVPSEHAGILGIEAEYEADAQNVEIAGRHRVVHVVLLDERVVKSSDDLTGLHRYFHLLFQVVAALDIEFGKVARDDPLGMLRHGQSEDIALCLLKRRQLLAVALKDRLAQVLAQALHFDHGTGGRYHHVDERGVVELHLFLEANELRRLTDAIDIFEQVKPKPLALAFLIAFAGPSFGKLYCCRF